MTLVPVVDLQGAVTVTLERGVAAMIDLLVAVMVIRRTVEIATTASPRGVMAQALGTVLLDAVMAILVSGVAATTVLLAAATETRTPGAGAILWTLSIEERSSSCVNRPGEEESSCLSAKFQITDSASCNGCFTHR